jgi:hypothetical protein
MVYEENFMLKPIMKQKPSVTDTLANFSHGTLINFCGEVQG